MGFTRMPNIVTPSQADTVPEVNRANAIKQAVSKVKAKKTLTKSEVELLQTSGSPIGSD